MSRVFEVAPASLNEADLALTAAAEAVRGGGLIVLPTETVHGLASRPDDPAATRRIFEAKRRPSHLALPVLAPDTRTALALTAGAGPTAGRLAEAFWPGPLTLVLSRGEDSEGWWLGDGDPATIAIRVPGHPLTAAVLERTGPLAATSANLSGSQPLKSRAELTRAFGELVEVYLVLPPSARAPAGVPSTVVDLTGERPAVLREGALGLDRLAEALGEPLPPTGSVNSRP
jgi:L-threonylcarbamoyladenylate synthase